MGGGGGGNILKLYNAIMLHFIMSVKEECIVFLNSTFEFATRCIITSVNKEIMH